MQFKVGDNVRITSPPKDKYLQYDLLNSIGVIKAIYNNHKNSNIAVEVQSFHNRFSCSGYFYFGTNNLEFININNSDDDNEENFMNNNYNVNEFKGSYIGVYVRFDDDNLVKYRLYPEDGFLYQENDMVVVKTKNHGFSVATIESFIDEKVTITGDREIVCPVNMTKFSERLSKANKIMNIRQEMDAKAKELQGIALYEMLAKNNTEMADMLEQYKQLIS